MDEKTALTYAITRALAYQENGGKPTTPKAGQSGELKSIFQFTPDTWKKDAGDVLGDPNAQLTPDNETKVVTEKVKQWIDKGYNAKQIASMWNAGTGEPDAYTGKFSTGKSSVGKNKFGVQFDVPKYADGVANYAKEFFHKEFKPKMAQAGQLASTQQPPQATPTGLPLAKKPTGGLLSMTPNLSIPSL